MQSSEFLGMKGKRLCRKVAAKRNPLDVSKVSTAELWGVILGDPEAGQVVASTLAGKTVEELADEGALARDLAGLPGVHEGRAGIVLAALVVGARTMRQLQMGRAA